MESRDSRPSPGPAGPTGPISSISAPGYFVLQLLALLSFPPARPTIVRHSQRMDAIHMGPHSGFDIMMLTMYALMRENNR